MRERGFVPTLSYARCLAELLSSHLYSSVPSINLSGCKYESGKSEGLGSPCRLPAHTRRLSRCLHSQEQCWYPVPTGLFIDASDWHRAPVLVGSLSHFGLRFLLI